MSNSDPPFFAPRPPDAVANPPVEVSEPSPDNAVAPEASLPDKPLNLPDDVIRLVPNVDGGVKFQMVISDEENQPATQAEREVLYPHTQRANDRLQAEMDLGRKRVAEAEARRRLNPPRVIPEKERMAQGNTTAVFRPGDFREYAAQFKAQHQTRSKDV